MAKKQTPEDLDKKLLEEQCILAIDDVHGWVRQYVALRTANGDYAKHGVILGADELERIKNFAYMLVDLVNDCKWCDGNGKGNH